MAQPPLAKLGSTAAQMPRRGGGFSDSRPRSHLAQLRSVGCYRPNFGHRLPFLKRRDGMAQPLQIADEFTPRSIVFPVGLRLISRCRGIEMHLGAALCGARTALTIALGHKPDGVHTQIHATPPMRS